MIDPQWLLAQEAEINAIKAEIIGMSLDNILKITNTAGEPVRFTYANFEEKAALLRAIANNIIHH